MENSPKLSNKFSLPKLLKTSLKVILFSVLMICIYFSLKSSLLESSIPPSVDLDFQNKTGAFRIKSSFNDLLVCSAGSIKQSNGYIVLLKIINPSSINSIRALNFSV